MSGLIELGLDIASLVLSGIIKGLVLGQEQENEIKRRVAIQLEKQNHLQKELYVEALRIALEEFSKLVELSGLKFSHDQVQLKKPLEVPVSSPKVSAEEELQILLEQLNTAVSVRRRELDLPMQSEEDVSPGAVPITKDDASNSSIQWVQVKKEEVGDPVAREIQEMLDRIRDRRSS